MPPLKKKSEILNDIGKVFNTELTTPDATTVGENSYYKNKDINEDIKLQELSFLINSNEVLTQNKDERKKYARYIFILTCIWAGLIFLLIFLVGFKLMTLSDKVIITLISSTTINFFGFFFLVIKYLFNTQFNKLNKNRKNAV